MKYILIFTIMLSAAQAAFCCTNFIVTKGASANGSTMVTYSADSHGLYGVLYHFAAARHAKGEMRKVTDWDSSRPLPDIAEAAETYNVVGNSNEHQLTIGETTFGGREELYPKEADGVLKGIDYGSLIYVALQRSKDARGAIATISALLDEYGYASEGESFSIADPNEAWIMEIMPDGNGGAVWVARLIPDGCVCGHANQARITTFPLKDKKNCLYHKNVIKLAREKGYFAGKDEEFSFADAYAPLDFGALRFCEARVWSGFRKMNAAFDKEFEAYARGDVKAKRLPLWIEPDHKVSRAELAEIMRDHYEGTSMDMTQDVGAGPWKCPYRWRPMEWQVDGVTYVHERAIATQQTGFWFVSEMRSTKKYGVIWFGVDDAATSVLVPYYTILTEVPEQVNENNGDIVTYSPTSLYWLVSEVAQKAYSRYQPIMGDLKPLQQKLENVFADEVEKSDNLMVGMSADDAVKLANAEAARLTKVLFDSWTGLNHRLLVKYHDGNVHPEEQMSDGSVRFKRNKWGNGASAEHPKYDEKTYRNIVIDAGERLKEK